jgi:uncharacterized protein (TIGR02001 family)
MKKFVLPAAMAFALVSAPAVAADLKGRVITKAPVVAAPPNPWDIAWGGAVMSDYNFRGISQSDRGPSATAYFEPRYNVSKDLQFYVGVAGSAVKLPTDPSAEIDFYGGVRPTFGPLALDLGFIYYYYPRERQVDGINVFPPAANPAATTLANTDFWEVYAKATYTFNDQFSVGGNVYYSPSWLNTGASGTYASGTFKWVTPWKWGDVGVYISGELGHYWIGTMDFNPIAYAIPFDFPDYTTWNIGLAFTYKVFTLDLRYYDTDLSKTNCYLLTTDQTSNVGIPGGTGPFNNPFGARSKWCDPAFVAKLSFDMTLDSLK